MMKCKACGAQLRGTEQYCPYCGDGVEQQAQPQSAPEQHIHIHMDMPRSDYVQGHDSSAPVPQPPARSDRSRLLLLLLLLFLGPLGIHCFYAGRIGKGVLYLLTGGLCGIGLLVDFFSIVLGAPKDGAGLPIRW